MRIDQDYLRTLLGIFLDSPRSFVELGDFQKESIAIDDKFLFHMQLLEDQSFVECLNEDKKIGYVIAMGGNFEWTSRPLRLSAVGHEFADALSRKEIAQILKSGFKDASMSTLKLAATELLTAFVKTQAEKHLGLKT
jgi:hypothetical protein